jgi:DNA-binding MarR family transcriptional regulator
VRPTEDTSNLSFDLHRLTARMDRAADRILSDAMGLSYRRFLALLLVQELGSPTQRALADALDVTEPSVSRMTAVLVEVGYLDAGVPLGGGNRRQLTLTPAGRHAVTSARDLLEARFAELVARSGVPYAAYSRHTRALLEALDPGQGRS